MKEVFIDAINIFKSNQSNGSEVLPLRTSRLQCNNPLHYCRSAQRNYRDSYVDPTWIIQVCR